MTARNHGFPALRFGDGAGNAAPLLDPTTGAPPPPVIKALQLPLVETFPIPGAQEFNVEGDQASVAIENNTTIATLGPVVVPQGYRAVIRSVSIYIDNMLTTTNVVWSVLLQGPGTSVAGYQNLRMFPRVAPFVGNTFDSLIRITGPASVTVIFSNLDGGTYQIGAALSGHLWLYSAEDNWRNRGGQWQ
jgi:hypothetical protein